MATGKISRLPREIREQVNRRLDEGEPGKQLVAWLNELPAVRALLVAEFGGAAIKEQNLTNWKQGGFREWRMQQEVAAWGRINAEGRRSQSNAEGEETFNAQHSTLNVQGDGKFVGPQIHPIEGQPTVTVEQLVTIVAVRYLAAVREWQMSPVPAERRWRQMRVILHDVMKLQRGEHREQRLELDRERLEFAMERFEEGKQTDVRRVMTAFLMAARQWPEVQEALAGAFRLLQERKGVAGNKAEINPIKVNQGEINFKKEEMQTGLEGCPPASRRDGARRSELAGQRPALPVVGARMDENLAKLKPIKVDQGEVIKKIETQGPGLHCRIYPIERRGRGHPPHPNLLPQGGEGTHVGQVWALGRGGCRGNRRVRLLSHNHSRYRWASIPWGRGSPPSASSGTVTGCASFAPHPAHRCDSTLQNNSVSSAQIQPRPAHLSVDNRPRRLDF